MCFWVRVTQKNGAGQVTFLSSTENCFVSLNEPIGVARPLPGYYFFPNMLYILYWFPGDVFTFFSILIDNYDSGRELAKQCKGFKSPCGH